MFKSIMTGLLLVISISTNLVFAQEVSSEIFMTNSTKSILDKVSIAKKEEYRSIIKDEILPLFDWEQISRETLGNNWRAMSLEQRKEFTQNQVGRSIATLE